MKHKRVGARLFSALMTLTLVLGLLPVTALAEETLAPTQVIEETTETPAEEPEAEVPAEEPKAETPAEENEAEEPEAEAAAEPATEAAEKSEAIATYANATTMDEGIYTVTANLYVPAEHNEILGINAYLTNTDVPPTSAVTDNAILTVKADKSMELEINELNSVFTLQKIGGCEDAEVVSSEKDETTYGPYKGRITSLKLNLKSQKDSGYYEFTNCEEYPTLLSQTWNVPLRLEVDFANAVQQYVPNENEQEFPFSDADAAVEVKTTADSMKNALEGATLNVTKSEVDDNEDIQSDLAAMYDSDPAFSVYFLGLKKDGESVAIAGNTQVTISLPADNATEVAVYQVNNGTTLKRINATVSDGKATFVAPRLGTFVVLDITDNYESIKVQYPNNSTTNAYFSFNSSTRYRKNRANLYAGYSALQPVEGSNAVGRTFVIGMKDESGSYATFVIPDDVYKYNENVPVGELSLTGKECDQDQNAYFVTETEGSKYNIDTPILTAEKLSSSVDENGNLTATIFSVKNYDRDAANDKLSLMANSLAGENVSGSSYAGKKGYILITDKKIGSMPVPKTAKSPYYYTSDKQGLYYSSKKYNLGNDDVTLTYSFQIEEGAKNVGNYTTTATLKDSTAYWADGTNTPKVMNWSIKQAHYSIRYSNTIKQGDAIEQVGSYNNDSGSKITNTVLKNLGFLNSDYSEKDDNLPHITSIDGLDDITTATKPGKYTVHLSRKETATIHTNSNFILDETGTGTLTVLPEGATDKDMMVDIPTGETLSYTGSPLTGVAENRGYTLTKKATDGGYQNLPEKTAGIERYEQFVKYWDSYDSSDLKDIDSYKRYYANILNEDWKDEYEGDLAEYGIYMNEMTDISATEPGTYTVIATPNKTVLNDGYYWWTDGTKDPKEITWTIEKKQNGGGNSGSADMVYKNATVNLYVAGSDNKILGFNAYLTNGNNPLGEGGYDKKAPTEPVSGNVDITVKNGKAYMTLEVPNPVFTLQDIDTESKDGKARITKKIRNSETYKNAAGDTRKGRITALEIELDDISGTHEYVFNNCEEFPTLLTTEWNVPLRLHVKFDGGDSGLDSNANADTSGIGGGGSSKETTADITVKVSGDTATVSKINTKDVSEKNDLVLNVTDGAKDVTGAKLPVSDLKTIADAKVPNTTVKLSDASVGLDLNALKAALKAATGSTLDIRALTGSAAEKKLSDAQKSALGDAKNGAAVYVELSSNGKAITELATGKLTVTAPYKWDGKGSVQAWQMDENGKLTSVPVSCKDNVATLTLTAPGAILLGTTDAQVDTETKTFGDVPANAYYKKAVDWAVENGITSGTSETTFAPDATCTRAQTVTFLWRAAGSPEPTKQDNPFTDVKADAYYYKAVLWAVEKGITSGVTATTFAPDATVSRAQVVSFQYRLAGAPKAEGTNVFTDVPANAYYRDAVLWAAQNGITSGTTATTFAPNTGCTRGQIVTFLYRQLANK